MDFCGTPDGTNEIVLCLCIGKSESGGGIGRAVHMGHAEIVAVDGDGSGDRLQQFDVFALARRGTAGAGETNSSRHQKDFSLRQHGLPPTSDVQSSKTL